MYPKILIISHNALSEHQSNGKTLNSIFKSWPADKIAQIYTLPEIPESKNCKKFFCITDYDQIESIINVFLQRKRKACRYLTIQERLFYQDKRHRIIRKLKSSFLSLVRDILWSLNLWKTKELLDWVDNFDPELVFILGGDSKFIYNIGLFISTYKKIPLILYFTDDYNEYNFNFNLFNLLKTYLIRKKIKNTIKKAQLVFAIGEDMALEYSNKFRKKVFVLRYCAEEKAIIKINNLIGRKGDDFHISYLGNIGLGRWRSLEMIAKAIDELSIKEKNIIFNIYSLEKPSNKQLLNIKKYKNTFFRGAIRGNEIDKVLITSDIVVFVESFQKRYKKLTRLSISTKINEYIAYGKCIFAYGPIENGTIRFLKNKEIAAVETNFLDLKEKLYNLIKSDFERRRYERAAYEYSKIMENRIDLNKLISEVIKNKNKAKYDNK